MKQKGCEGLIFEEFSKCMRLANTPGDNSKDSGWLDVCHINSTKCLQYVHIIAYVLSETTTIATFLDVLRAIVVFVIWGRVLFVCSPVVLMFVSKHVSIMFC